MLSELWSRCHFDWFGRADQGTDLSERGRL